MTEPPAQLTRDDLRTMKPAEILAAKADGQLDRLLGVPESTSDLNARLKAGEQLTQEDVGALYKAKRYSDIADAKARGQVRGLLGASHPTDHQ